MAGEKAREYYTQQTHFHAAKVNHTNYGAGALAFGDLPACQIVDINVSKTADFNAGSTATISVGVSGTANNLVNAAGLTSATALGPLETTQVDGAAFTVAAPTELTLTVAGTGTLPTTGEAIVIVEYIPLSGVKNLTA